MAGSLYKGYLRLCEKWGVDLSKQGRDLGEAIRLQVAKEFSRGDASHIASVKDCERKLESLNRLAANHYGKIYKRGKYVSVTNLTLEDCRKVLSNEGLQHLNEQSASLKDRIRLYFNRATE